MMDFLNNPVHVSILALYVVLSIASLIVFILRRRHPEKNYRELADRTKSWWVMITIFSLALVISPTISVIFFGLLSFLAFKEFVSIIQLRKADRRVIFWAYLTIPIQYYLVAIDWYGMFIVFIPVWVFFLLPFRFIVQGQTEGFLRSVSIISWGLMITVFAISHAAMLLQLPDDISAHVAGGAGLILFLALLNQGNDVAQYVWGKLFGRHKIVPLVSPKKTWEGFIGGLVTTTLIAGLIAPYLTPFSLGFAMFAGAMIAATGFIGDVTFSALKRDIGLKDTGSIIPGHGGILDRIDSLSLSAPVFFHLVHYVYY